MNYDISAPLKLSKSGISNLIEIFLNKSNLAIVKILIFFINKCSSIFKWYDIKDYV